MKKMVIALVLVSLMTMGIVACSRDGAPTVSSPASPVAVASPTTPPDTVHMNDDAFLQKSITIHKGESVTLIDDVSTLHVIANGTWQNNGIPLYHEETGAPSVQIQVQDKGSHQIGPFTTAGTFHFYCTVHQDMSLTVIVQ
jgi:plastocyanin